MPTSRCRPRSGYADTSSDMQKAMIRMKIEMSGQPH